MNRVLISALAVLAALLLWQDARHARQNAAHAANEVRVIAAQRDDAEARLEAANRKSEIERGVLLKRAATAESQLADAQAQNKELAYALKASPVWADTPIPDGVLDALGGSTN